MEKTRFTFKQVIQVETTRPGHGMVLEKSGMIPIGILETQATPCSQAEHSRIIRLLEQLCTSKSEEFIGGELSTRYVRYRVPSDDEFMVFTVIYTTHSIRDETWEAYRVEMHKDPHEEAA